MSIEALAMAGVDYTQCAIDFEILELDQTPLYLVAEESSSSEIETIKRNDDHVLKLVDEEWRKGKMLEWLKDSDSENDAL